MGLRAARSGSSVRTRSGQPANAGWAAKRRRRLGSSPNAGPPTTRQPPQKTRTSVTSGGGAASRRELPRQLAHRIAQAEPDALRALVHRGARVVEGVHRQVREDVEVGLGVGAREDVLEGRPEVAQVHRPVGHEQELGERELALAQDAEGRGHGLALVALLDHRRGQRVVAGLAVGPEARTAGHHQREERREQLLEEVADEEVLLPRLAHHGGGVDRVAPAAQVGRRGRPGSRGAASSSRSGRRRALGPALAAAHRARRGRSPRSPPAGAGPGRAPSRSRSPAMSEASSSSGTFSGRGAIAARIRAGGPPRKTVTGRALALRLRHGVVEAAALADLPVHAGGARVVDVQAVDAEVGAPLPSGCSV